MINIYALADPRNPEDIRYIGKTSLTLKERLNAHINKVKYRRCHSSYWIKSLLIKGIKPIIILINEVPEEDWIESEIFYIALYKVLGYKLTNHTIGGEGATGYRHTEEFKESRRKAVKKGYIRKYSSREEAYKAHSELMKKTSRIKEFSNEASLKKAVENSIKKTSKKVYEIDNNGNILNTFKSVAECSRITGLIDSNIARACRQPFREVKGRKFKY